MAAIAKKQMGLQLQPQLSFRGVDFNEANVTSLGTGASAPGLGLQLVLGNPGSTLVHYKVEGLSCSLCGTHITESDFQKSGGVIHPGEETRFLLPVVPTTTTRLLPSYELTFKISFWAIKEEKRALHASVLVNILGSSPLRWQWIFREGPDYT